jgi:hypothetical protein
LKEKLHNQIRDSNSIKEGHNSHYLDFPVLNQVKHHLFTARLVTFICSEALAIEYQFPQHVKYAFKNENSETHFTQRQILCILCHAFLNLLPPQNQHFDGQHLTFEIIQRKHTQKLKCLLYYFQECQRRIEETPNWTGRIVSIFRRSFQYITSPNNSDTNTQSTHPSSSNVTTILHDLSINGWINCDDPITKFIYHESGALENVPHSLHADFANKYIGGGVLRGGCVQEEIRFMINPECLITILLCEKMNANESILIRGTERFCYYDGA